MLTETVTAATTDPASDTSAVGTVLNLALSYLVSRGLHVATELGVADHLTRGPLAVADLAACTAAHPASLRRLLRMLAAHGVFTEDASGRFANTPASALLQRGIMHDGVLFCGNVSGDDAWWNAVGALRHSVATGAPAFDYQQGAGFFDYLAAHPEGRRWFDRGMANFAEAENPVIATSYDFAATPHVVDIGGGQGGLLVEILGRHAQVRGTLFDLAEVVRDPAYITAARLEPRCTMVAGDFFEQVPAGADAYVLKRILHDWSDEQCVRILRACCDAMSTRARLLVVDCVVPHGNTPHPGKVMDILMMVFAAGRERTEDEFAQLLQQAGLRLCRVLPTASALSIVEAARA